MRPTPFALAFADLARDRFPAIALVLERDVLSSADRDRFLLLEPVGRLLREIAPDGTGADALEAHMLMLHHAYRYWAGGRWVYRIGETALRRAAGGGGTSITSHLPHPSVSKNGVSDPRVTVGFCTLTPFVRKPNIVCNISQAKFSASA